MSLPNQRREITLVAAGDKVLFAGGIDGNNKLSSEVAVFDTSTREWTYFNLTQPRRRISADSYGTKIIFVGGIGESNVDSRVMEIYDLNIDSLTSILIPEQYRYNRVIMGQSKAIIFGNAHETTPIVPPLLLDLTTLEFTPLETRSINPYYVGATNETHAFLITRTGDMIYIVDLETLTISDVVVMNVAATLQVIYSDGFVYFLGPRRAVLYSTTTGNTITYMYRQSRARSATATVVINQKIYRIGSGYTIIDPFLELEIQHNLPQNTHFDMSAAANGMIFARLDNGQFSVFNTHYTLMPLLTLSTRATFISRDVIFFFQEPSITTYDFNSRSLTVHPAAGDRFRSQNPIYVLLDHKLAYASQFIGQVSVFLYDFDSHSVDTIDLPINTVQAAVAFGDLLAFASLTQGLATLTIHLFDINENSLTTVPLAALHATLYKDSILAVLVSSSVVLYDVVERKALREFPINGQWTSIHAANDVLFATRMDGDLAYTIDVRSSDIRTHQFAAPMSRLQMVVVGNYAAFTGLSLTQTQPVELFDTTSVTWRSVVLPRTLYSNRVILAAIGDKLFIGRSITIDAVDVKTGAITTLPFPVSDLATMTTLGSKLIVQSHPPGVGIVTITIYEVTTGDWTFLTLPSIDSLIGTVSNYLFVNVERTTPYIMPLSTLLEGFNGKELFIGQSTNLTVTTAGPPLRYQWTHEGQAIQDGNPALILDNVTMHSDGMYRVDMLDHCNFHIVHQARLTVHDVPMFSVPLKDSVALCDRVEELPIEANGVAVEYTWTIDGVTVDTNSSPTLSISTSHMPCNTRALVCAYASNPSGQTQSCARVKMLELDSVIRGPLPSTTPPTWFSNTTVELSVDILERDCTSHVWYVNGVNVTQAETRSSTLSVELSPSMATYQYYVVATCGNSLIESRRFSFEQVSPLPVYGVVLLVIGVFLGVAVFIVVIVLQRKKLNQSQDKEVELSALLSNAKTDSLMKESMPIINKTTWQWKPSEDFSYKSLDSLPVDIDTSQLKFVEKGEPLDIEMNFNKELQISSRTPKKTKKSTILTEKLISGTKIDIYAPQSPKYEVTVEPETLYVERGESHSVTVSVRMRMTTRCKVVLIVVLEQQKIYSAIEFKLDSKMSTWIDLEEIEMSGEFLGGGG